MSEIGDRIRREYGGAPMAIDSEVHKAFPLDPEDADRYNRELREADGEPDATELKLLITDAFVYEALIKQRAGRQGETS